jgi:hypothetical protein
MVNFFLRKMGFVRFEFHVRNVEPMRTEVKVARRLMQARKYQI